jgi:hypothetical protein
MQIKCASTGHKVQRSGSFHGQLAGGDDLLDKMRDQAVEQALYVLLAPGCKLLVRLGVLTPHTTCTEADANNWFVAMLRGDNMHTCHAIFLCSTMS